MNSDAKDTGDRGTDYNFKDMDEVENSCINLGKGVLRSGIEDELRERIFNQILSFRKYPFAPAERYFKLRITLTRARPKTVRVIAAPASLTLAEMVYVIGAAFGWRQQHVSGFDEMDYRGGPLDDYDLKTADILVAPVNRTYREITLEQALPNFSSTLTYRYDFYQNIRHRIEVADSNYRPKSGDWPVKCLESRGPHVVEDGYTVDDAAYADDIRYFRDGEPTEEWRSFQRTLTVTPEQANASLEPYNQLWFGRVLRSGDPQVQE